MLRSKITQFRTHFFTFLVLTLTVCLSASGATGPVSIYLQLSDDSQVGNIVGEVIQGGHEGKIEVRSWSWGIENILDAATGLPTGKEDISDLSIEKYIDKSTPLLLVACQGRSLFSEVILQSYRPGGSGAEYLSVEITLSDVWIPSVELGESVPPDGRTTELVSFTFGSAKFKYTTESGDSIEIEIESDSP